MRFGKLVAGLIAGAFCLQAVGNSIMGRSGIHRAARRQENRLRDPHRLLMFQEHLIAPAGIIQVLMVVNDRLGMGFLPGHAPVIQPRSHRQQARDELPSREWTSRPGDRPGRPVRVSLLQIRTRS